MKGWWKTRNSTPNGDCRPERPGPLRSSLALFVSLVVYFCWAFSGQAYAFAGNPQEPRRDLATANWRFLRADCDVPMSRWQIRPVDWSDQLADTRQALRIEFTNGHGSELLVVSEPEPALIIDELNFHVRCWSDHPGIGLMVRAVLPETQNPDGSGPMTVMIAGPTTNVVGQWSELSFDENGESQLAREFQRQLWGLRRQLGQHLSAQNAYVDQVILNLYSGPGSQKVYVEPPRVSGFAQRLQPNNQIGNPIIHDPAVKLTSHQQEVREPALVRRNGTVFEHQGEPFLPKIVQHNGEPLAALAALGFNTVQLTSTATDFQLQEARDLRLWLICPPPASIGIKPINTQFDRVLAWSLGEKLGEAELLTTQQRCHDLRLHDFRSDRPLVASVVGDWLGYSQILDAMIIQQPTWGSDFPLHRLREWVHEVRESLGNRIPIWVDLTTETPASLTRQAIAMTSQAPPTPCEPQRYEYATLQAIAGGARAIRCQSRTRLDATDPVSRLRAINLEWLNRKLNQLEPWLVGGTVMGDVPSGQANLQITSLKTNRAQLLICQPSTGNEAWVVGDIDEQQVVFRDIYSAVADRGYLLADYGLIPINYSGQGVEANQIQLERVGSSATVVMTQDPLVINRLSASYQVESRRPLTDLRLELTQHWLVVSQLVNNQLNQMGQIVPAATSALDDATVLVNRAGTLMRDGSPITAIQQLQAAERKLAIVRRELIAAARQQFSTRSSVPLTTHFSFLPLHWQLLQRTREVTWQANGLAGGDFENLEHLLAVGWENSRSSDNGIKTLVELSSQAMVAGEFGLKLEAQSLAGSTSLVHSTPLKISSAPVTMASGKLYRIHGWVNVSQTITGSREGLVIYDSVAGRDLGLRVSQTNGWEEFTLYRSTIEPTAMRLSFHLTGLGTVLLDEVTVTAMDLPPEIAERIQADSIESIKIR